MPWDWKSRCCLSMCHAAFAIPTGRNSAWNPWSLRCAGNWAPWFRPIISMKFRPRSTICSASVAISLPAWARCASNPFFAWGTALPMGRRKSRDWPINKCGNGWRGKTSMPELLARGTLLRWMGWFALANALLLAVAGLRYFNGFTPGGTPLSWLYLGLVFPAHYVLLAGLPPFLLL